MEKTTIMHVLGAKFSSDRAVGEYARNIWGIAPLDF